MPKRLRVIRRKRRVPHGEGGGVMTEASLEKSYRRQAEKAGLMLRKRGDGYMVVDVSTNGVVAGAWPTEFSLTLEDVGEVLQQYREE